MKQKTFCAKLGFYFEFLTDSKRNGRKFRREITSNFWYKSEKNQNLAQQSEV